MGLGVGVGLRHGRVLPGPHRAWRALGSRYSSGPLPDRPREAYTRPGDRGACSFGGAHGRINPHPPNKWVDGQPVPQPRTPAHHTCPCPLSGVSAGGRGWCHTHERLKVSPEPPDTSQCASRIPGHCSLSSGAIGERLPCTRTASTRPTRLNVPMENRGLPCLASFLLQIAILRRAGPITGKTLRPRTRFSPLVAVCAQSAHRARTTPKKQQMEEQGHGREPGQDSGRTLSLLQALANSTQARSNCPGYCVRVGQWVALQGQWARQEGPWKGEGGCWWHWVQVGGGGGGGPGAEA